MDHSRPRRTNTSSPSPIRGPAGVVLGGGNDIPWVRLDDGIDRGGIDLPTWAVEDDRGLHALGCVPGLEGLEPGLAQDATHEGGCPGLNARVEHLERDGRSLALRQRGDDDDEDVEVIGRSVVTGAVVSMDVRETSVLSDSGLVDAGPLLELAAEDGAAVSAGVSVVDGDVSDVEAAGVLAVGSITSDVSVRSVWGVSSASKETPSSTATPTTATPPTISAARIRASVRPRPPGPSGIEWVPCPGVQGCRASQRCTRQPANRPPP